MRSFFRSHWKVIVAIILLVLLALVTVNPGAAAPGPPLSARLRAHLAAIDGSAGLADAAARRAGAAAYISAVLHGAGYPTRPSGAHDIEAVLGNLAPGARAQRSFVIGARDDAGGVAAVLELARLLKDVRPSAGTEIRFVFFLDPLPAAAAEPLPGGGSFIAFSGALSSARRVQDALAAFQGGGSEAAGHGLAAPAYLQGVTLSDRTGAMARGAGAPVTMVTDTGFTQYPYHQLGGVAGQKERDGRDVEGMARVLAGVARTIAALAAGQRG